MSSFQFFSIIAQKYEYEMTRPKQAIVFRVDSDKTNFAILK